MPSSSSRVCGTRCRRFVDGDERNVQEVPSKPRKLTVGIQSSTSPRSRHHLGRDHLAQVLAAGMPSSVRANSTPLRSPTWLGGPSSTATSGTPDSTAWTPTSNSSKSPDQGMRAHDDCCQRPPYRTRLRRTPRSHLGDVDRARALRQLVRTDGRQDPESRHGRTSGRTPPHRHGHGDPARSDGDVLRR
jgi:hypothetical protein